MLGMFAPKRAVFSFPLFKIRHEDCVEPEKSYSYELRLEIGIDKNKTMKSRHESEISQGKSILSKI